MLSVAGGILEHSDRLCASHCSSEASLALKIVWEKVLLAFSFDVLSLPRKWGKFSI
jgi:hypothetical protein